MTTVDAVDLLELLERAREADPSIRIDYRDPIARYGGPAIQAVRSWLGEPTLAAFAVRVIEKAAAENASARALAIESLSAVRGHSFTKLVQADAAQSLKRLGVGTPAKSTRQSKASADAPGALTSLVQGHLYRRRDLREAGLLGNLYSGISYPADGVHACLFSGGDNSDSYGYRDMPWGENRYRYFGEWRGSRDMSLTGGNRAIVDRSPNLYLFASQGSGFHRFEGRFMVIEHERVVAEREGTIGEALVFVLERVAARVTL